MTEWDAPGYEKIAELQAAMAAEALSLLNLKGTERILDLGCGSGKITAEIARRVPEGDVTGVDSILRHDRVRLEKLGLLPANRIFIMKTADIRRLTFCEEFDLIVSFNALHWIPEQEEALRSIRSAMKPGGSAQLRLVPKGARKSLEDVIEETRLALRWRAYFREFHDPYLHLTPAQYAALAEQSGLEVRRLHRSDKAWDFGSHEAFLAFGSVTFIAWTQFLPASERPAFVADVLERYRESRQLNRAKRTRSSFIKWTSRSPAIPIRSKATVFAGAESDVLGLLKNGGRESSQPLRLHLR